MRKTWVVAGMAVAVLALVAVAALAAANPVAAQDADAGAAKAPTATPAAGAPWGGMLGGGMMGGVAPGSMMGGTWQRGRMGGGMLGATRGGGYGVMHDAMWNALADELGLSRAELDDRVAAGETPLQIAQAEGFTSAEFYDLMLAARQTAIEQLVADGTLTQAQADWMLSHMAGRGAGFGTCPGHPGGVPAQQTTQTRGPRG